MSAIARPRVITTNVVDLQIASALPVPMEIGSISLTCSFEAQPSGSLEYTVASEADLDRLESAYRIGRTFSINGVSVAVSSYAYTRERAYWKDLAIDTYSVSISLGGVLERRLKGSVDITSIIDRKTGKVTVGQVAGKGRIPYSGPGLSFIPSGTDIGVEDAITSNIRRAGSFVDYNGSAVRAIPMGGGGGFRFGVDEILTDGANSKSELPFHKNAVLNDTWSKLPEDSTDTEASPEFDREEPARDKLVEVDREDYYLPPPDTKVLRTLDSNADKGGPKAVKKEVTLEDGQRVLEKVWVYGFKYLAEDINVGNGVLFSDSPEDFWGIVEYTETTVSFDKLNPGNISLIVYGDDGQPCRVIVHPDYTKFVSGGGNSFSISSTAQYMVKEEVTGYRWARLKEENESETLYPEDPFYGTYKFRKLPKIGKRTWRLTSTREAFGSKGGEDQFGHPFRVEYLALKDLPPALRSLSGYDEKAIQENPEKLLAVVYPETNYIEPLYVDTEVDYNSTFYSEPHPESTEDSPQPPLITGSEVYNWARHVPYSNLIKQSQKVTVNKSAKADHYKKLSSNYTSQDAGFARSALIVKSQEFAGQPPAATTRNRAWEEKAAQAAQAAAQSGESTTYYKVTSSAAQGSDADSGGVTVQNAASLGEAVRAIGTQLRIDACNAVQSSRQIAWWIKGIRPGSTVSVEKDRFRGGRWMVMSVAWNLEVIGNTQYTSGPMQLTSGTALTLGLDINQGISTRKFTEDGDPAAGGGGAEGRRFVARYSFSKSELGEVIPQDVIGRRSFEN